jgi:hypothetical protein
MKPLVNPSALLNRADHPARQQQQQQQQSDNQQQSQQSSQLNGGRDSLAPRTPSASDHAWSRPAAANSDRSAYVDEVDCFDW